MKKQLHSLCSRSLILMFLVFGFLSNQKTEAQFINSGISFQIFYDELAPYGNWVRDTRYGFIWIPTVSQNFHPYGTEGHWIMTEYGNTWVSYYDWGWAPFHYGRWTFDNYYRAWAWIPDYEWGPAWVNWRTGGGYYGWAPLGPGFSVNIQANLPSFYWTFVPQNRLTYRNVHRFHVRQSSRMRIYNNTTIINNTVVYNNITYIGGPQRRDIERATRSSVRVYNVNNSSNPGRAAFNRNAVELYRPDLNATRGRSQEARPSRIVNAEEIQTNRSQGRTNVAPKSSNPSRTSNSDGYATRNREPQTRPAQRTDYQNSRATSTAPSQGGRSQASPSQGGRSQVAPNQERSSRSVNTSTPTRTTPAVRNQGTQKANPSSKNRGNSNSRSVQPAKTTRSEGRTVAPSRNGSRTEPRKESQSNNPAGRRSGSRGGN